MPYAYIPTFEGLLADDCLRHGIGNPYAETVSICYGRHRAQAYAQAVKLIRLYKTPQGLAHYRGLWESYLKATKSRNVLEPLEEAAKAGHEAAFRKALAEIDWQNQTAGQFVRAIDLALQVGSHLAARRLASECAHIHFDDEELQKYSRVLNPLKVKADRKATQVDQSANVDWLKMHKNQYKGKWVAIKDGKLLDAANSYDELVATVGNTKGTGILTTKLY